MHGMFFTITQLVFARALKATESCEWPAGEVCPLQEHLSVIHRSYQVRSASDCSQLIGDSNEGSPNRLTVPSQVNAIETGT